MRWRALLAALMLVGAQAHGAFAAPVSAAPASAVPADAHGQAHGAAGPQAAAEPPCHGASAPAESTAIPDAGDHAGHESHESRDGHGCCDSSDCDGAGCHCTCSAVPALRSVAPQLATALWVVRAVSITRTAVPSLPPWDPLRPPI